MPERRYLPGKVLMSVLEKINVQPSVSQIRKRIVMTVVFWMAKRMAKNAITKEKINSICMENHLS